MFDHRFLSANNVGHTSASATQAPRRAYLPPNKVQQRGLKSGKRKAGVARVAPNTDISGMGVCECLSFAGQFFNRQLECYVQEVKEASNRPDRGLTKRPKAPGSIWGCKGGANITF